MSDNTFEINQNNENLGVENIYKQLKEVLTLREFIKIKHGGVGEQKKFALANSMKPQLVSDKLKQKDKAFLIIDGDMYRLAKEGIK